MNSGLCSFWSTWNLQSLFNSEHVTLALSETSIWEFWGTTGQQELSWLHGKETFIHVLHHALRRQQDPSVEGDVASLWYATGKWFLPAAGCCIGQASGQPPWCSPAQRVGEICLSSALLLAAGRREELPPEELAGLSSLCVMEGPCLLAQESVGGLEGNFSGKQWPCSNKQEAKTSLSWVPFRNSAANVVSDCRSLLGIPGIITDSRETRGSTRQFREGPLFSEITGISVLSVLMETQQTEQNCPVLLVWPCSGSVASNKFLLCTVDPSVCGEIRDRQLLLWGFLARLVNCEVQLEGTVFRIGTCSTLV